MASHVSQMLRRCSCVHGRRRSGPRGRRHKPTGAAVPPPPPPSAAGTLQRDFKHLAVDMFLTEEEGQKVLKVDCHFGKRKALASIRTCTSHVQVGCWPCAGPRRLPAAGIASLEGPLWAAHLPSTCQKA